MKKSVKTLAATLLTGVMAFGTINANAMSPKDQDAFGKAKITAAQALSAAQAKIGADAKVKGIDFKHHYFGKDHFEVEMFANGQKQKVAVDANSGQIIDIPQKHEGKHHKHNRFEKGERHEHHQNEGGFRQN